MQYLNVRFLYKRRVHISFLCLEILIENGRKHLYCKAHEVIKPGKIPVQLMLVFASTLWFGTVKANVLIAPICRW